MSEIFSKRLKKIREEKKLSQAELAQKADLQTAAISHFETGQRKPSFDNLKRLADALNVSVDFLLGREFKESGDIAERLFRDFEKLSTNDQQKMQEFAEFLAKKDKKE
jgi:transcriptional regulator with XRE-family HTH domain